jgi:hypothetical protein
MPITQADFFINASTGNDTDNGATPATALRTHAELEQRINAGGKLLIPPVGASGLRITTVNILTDLPDTDPINLDGVVLGKDTYLLYKGGVASTDRTGTFTDVVAMNPASNQPFEVEDTAMPGAWQDHLGRRIRITAGARENTIMWVAKDLGTNRARVSNPSIVKALVGAPFDEPHGLNAQVPEPGDSYAVETLRKVSLGVVHVKSQGSKTISSIPVIALHELEVRDESSGGGIASIFCDKIVLVMHSCRMMMFLQGFNWPTGAFVNCFVHLGLVASGTLGTFLHGGLVGVRAVSAPGGVFAGIRCDGGGTVFLADDVMLQDVGMRGQNLIIEAASVFDSVATFLAPGGHGVFAGGIGVGYIGGTVSLTSVFSGQPPRLWGSGNAGVGVEIGPGAQLVYRTGTFPTITGLGGDFTLAGATSGRAWDDTAGAYTTARSTTWANLATTIASGGFGGSAHNPMRDAHVVDGL